jgi:hypothetical protein
MRALHLNYFGQGCHHPFFFFDHYVKPMRVAGLSFEFDFLGGADHQRGKGKE